MDGLFPVIGAGDVAGAGGPWFNHQGRRVECDAIRWEQPDGTIVWVRLDLVCPQCGHPLSVVWNDSLVRVDDDGRITIGAVLQCPGYWPQRDQHGQQLIGSDGRPALVRCGWVGLVREGVAHRVNCTAVHTPGCPAPSGGGCNCRFGRWGQPDACNCGSVTVRE